MYPAQLHHHWLKYDGEPFTFDGVPCCVHVKLYGEGQIRVELVPKHEEDSKEWPVDVLRLPAAKQQEMLDQLRREGGRRASRAAYWENFGCHYLVFLVILFALAALYVMFSRHATWKAEQEKQRLYRTQPPAAPAPP